MGPYAFRWAVLFCLCPLFVIVDAVIDVEPFELTPRNFLETLEALSETLGFQISLLLFLVAVCVFFLDALLESLIELVDISFPVLDESNYSLTYECKK
ncbi:hypothetical protein BKA64DRAFT_669694 [Cadophora sp. MPI-SDFR-AT-0126]|nr:hypothetical protein BKA64DRAFT_669694 [Leotiomycetes sp. MPI-SDFR-AT-0126]